MSEARLSGHCLCGAITVTLTNPKDHVEVCHCDMCKRQGGAFYGALESESFELTGEDALGVYRSSEWAERGFCSKCGSSLFYHFLPTGNRSFAAGLFEGANTLPVSREIFVDEKASWCPETGDHPRLTGEEVIAEAKAAGFSFD